MDAAWHECILETEVYQKHCQRLLASQDGFVHHNPDGGMDSDREDRYRTTCDKYKELFGEKGPEVAWERLECDPNARWYY